MNDDEPFLTDDEIALHAEVKLLRLEHADLDASIEALSHMPIPDQLLIARLKRKKLPAARRDREDRKPDPARHHRLTISLLPLREKVTERSEVG